MNQVKPDRLVPVVAGGALIGVLSAIPFVSCGCCVWGTAGGALAAYLFIRNYPATLPPVTMGEGALLGLFAGIAGAVIDVVISIPLHLMRSEILGGDFQQQIREALSAAQLSPEAEAMMEGLLTEGGTGFLLVIGFLISLVVFSILGCAGGAIGVALFQKKSAPPPAPWTPPAPPPTPPAPPAEGGPVG